MVEDSRIVLREAALLFVIEKAVPPRRWISIRQIFFVGDDVERDDGYRTVTNDPNSFQAKVQRGRIDGDVIKER